MTYLVYGICFLISFLLQFFVINYADKNSLYDLPGERKVHTRPIPRLGGIGIFIAFTAGFFFFGFSMQRNFMLIYSGALVIFFMNIFDDVIKDGINNKVKLLVQIILASILFYFGINITVFISSRVFSFIITLLWIIGITNSFNLLDNMNGLSAGVAMIGLFFLGVIMYSQGDIQLMRFTFVLLFSIAGFFVLNFPKARIFMGDAGSNVIGFVIACLAVSGQYVAASRLTRLPVIAPLIILSVPIYDTLSVMIIRKMKGYSIFRADTNHISHRLTRMGLSHTDAVLVIFLISIITGLNGLILKDLYLYSAFAVLGQLILFYILLTVLVYAGKKED